MVTKRILVVCTHNSARSQIAEAYLRRFLGERAEVHSAGTNPTGIHPLAQAVMQEVGYDLSTHSSDSIQKYLGQQWDYVITVCDHAKETCPYVPAKSHIHVSFPDPSRGDIETFRQVRDAIRIWAASFAESI
ncbi:MAG: arsenate reductase ArsC [Bacteroidia bacterium]